MLIIFLNLIQFLCVAIPCYFISTSNSETLNTSNSFTSSTDGQAHKWKNKLSSYVNTSESKKSVV